MLLTLPLLNARHAGPAQVAIGPGVSLPLICDTDKVNTGAAETTRTDCTLDGTSYATSCATWLAGIGQAVRQLGKPVVFTFAHEFNVAGQYPWAQGDTGSCGSSPCTPAQWIAAWDAVQAQIDSNGASAYASWMWAPNADTGGSTVNFTPWWPGAAHVGMAGLDGYPQGGPGWGLCNFQELFGRSFTEMKSLTSLPVFISETDLAPLSTSQDCNGGSYQTITSFMAGLFKDGGDGILQFQDGTPALTSAQWSELDAALAKAPHPAPASFPAPSPDIGEHTSHRNSAWRAHAFEFRLPDA